MDLSVGLLILVPTMAHRSCVVGIDMLKAGELDDDGSDFCEGIRAIFYSGKQKSKIMIYYDL